MTNNLKCPFCSAELRKEQGSERWWYCVNAKCVHKYTTTHETIWQALIQAKQDLERTRKALDVAVDALKGIDWCATDYGVAQEALDKITALEQKE